MDSGVLDAIFDTLLGDLLKQLRSALHIMALFVSYKWWHHIHENTLQMAVKKATRKAGRILKVSLQEVR